MDKDDKSIVLDTNVLIDGCSKERKWTRDCEEIIRKIDNGLLQLGVDAGGEILNEYEKHLKKFKGSIFALGPWGIVKRERYQPAGKDHKIKPYEPIPENKVENLLKMGFHDKDIIFVRIAPQTRCKLIISSDENSFLNKKYIGWLKKELKIITKPPYELEEIEKIVYNSLKGR